MRSSGAKRLGRVLVLAALATTPFASAQDRLLQKTYDVSELLESAADDPGELRQWPPHARQIDRGRPYTGRRMVLVTPRERPIVTDQERAAKAGTLIEEVRRTIDPGSWTPAGPGTIKFSDGCLHVRQLPRVHAAIDERVQSWWRASPRSTQIALEARVFVVPEAADAAAEAWLAKAGAMAAGPAGYRGRLLTEEQAREFRRVLAADRTVRAAACLYMMNFDGQLNHRRVGPVLVQARAWATPPWGVGSARVTLEYHDTEVLKRDDSPWECPLEWRTDRLLVEGLGLSSPVAGAVWLLSAPLEQHQVAEPAVAPPAGETPTPLPVRPVAGAPKRRVYFLLRFQAAEGGKEKIGPGGIPAGYTMSQEERDFLPALEAQRATTRPRRFVFSEEDPLHVAAEKGYLGVVKQLVDRGTYPDVTWAGAEIFQSGGFTPVAMAAKKGRLDVVKFLLRRGARVDGDRLAPLYAAVEGNHAEVADCLIRWGADVNLNHERGHGPAIRRAVAERNMPMIQLLLEAGARLDDPRGLDALGMAIGDRKLFEFLLAQGADIRRSGCLALALEAEKIDEPLVDYLLAKGARLDGRQSCRALASLARKGRRDLLARLIKGAADINGLYQAETALHGMMYPEGQLQAATLLLDLGADVNARGEFWTPLQKAARYGNKPAVQLLLDRGANPNATDTSGQSALFYAYSPEMVRLLLARGAAIGHRDQEGKTALHVLIRLGPPDDLPVVQALVAAGADLHARDKDGRSPLRTAVYNGKTDIVKFLVAKGADVKAEDARGDGLLREAVNEGTPELWEFLIAQGADPARLDKEGQSLLFHAAKPWQVKLLLARKLSVAARDPAGETPLHRADNDEVAAALLAAGADPNAPDKQARTPLHTVAEFGWVSRLTLLHKAGAKLEAPDSAGRTPLHLAAANEPRHDWWDTPKLDTPGPTETLLSLGAAIAARDAAGRTPLHLANVYATRVLLKRKADPNARDKAGQTPLHLALRDPDRVKALIDAGADPALKDARGQTPLDLAQAAVNEAVPPNLPDLIRFWSAPKPRTP